MVNRCNKKVWSGYTLDQETEHRKAPRGGPNRPAGESATLYEVVRIYLAVVGGAPVVSAFVPDDVCLAVKEEGCEALAEVTVGSRCPGP